MAVILGVLVFGVLGAITIYGYMQSERSYRERTHGDYSQARPMAMTASDRQRADSPSTGTAEQQPPAERRSADAPPPAP